MSQVPYSKGDRVEIRRASPLSPLLPGGQRSGGGGAGAFYSATVLVSHARTRAQILVEYDSVRSPFCSLRPLREYVPWANARPAPPRELGRRFRMGEAVEAYVEEGWHLGVVLEVLEGGSRYLVLLEGPEEEVEFAQSNLRLRRNWTGGGWDPPFPGQQLRQWKPSPVESKPEKSRRPKITSGRTKSAPLFRNGRTVEVRNDEEGFEGAWYTAAIKGYLGNDNYLVEYFTLKTDDRTAPLREEAHADNIRPYPPWQLQVPFRPLDKVDAWYNDGWWEGMISEVLNGSAFLVYFSKTNEELIFQEFNLRIHQDWIDQKWVALQDTLDHLGTPARNLKSDMHSDTSSKVYFHRGMKVEIRIGEDGYQGSWYTAVILDSTGEDKYLVEYQTLKTDDESELLKEEVRATHVRPCPPADQKVYGFSRFEAVDAWYNEGWWMGHVSKILEGSNYQVYFRCQMR